MVKILLIWGEDQNESEVTKTLANLLKPLLEKRGFEVEIAQMPENATLHYNAEHNGDPRQPVHDQIEYTVRKKIETRSQFVINLHTQNTTMGINRNPKFFSAREFKFDENFIFGKIGDAPIGLAEVTKGFFVLEIPAKYVAARTEWIRLLKNFQSQNKPVSEPYYFQFQTDLKKTIDAKLLNPLILAKIAHLINTTIRTKINEFHSPRRLPFKTKRNSQNRARMGRRFNPQKPI